MNRNDSMRLTALHNMMTSAYTNYSETLGFQKSNHLGSGQSGELRHELDLRVPVRSASMQQEH